MVFLCLYALLEFAVPEWCITMWHRFIQSRFLPAYGILLILGGFPLTRYAETLAGKFLFGAGIIIVFTGPFILLFPEHFRSVFDQVTDESTPADLRRLAYTDGIIRLILAGIIFVVRYL
ncbi:MAG: hypothetical protein ACOC2H_05745 [Spirochaetota bacterium]